MVAEKRLNLTQLGQLQPDDNEGYTVGFDEDTVRRTTRAPSPDYLGTVDQDGGRRFGSSHPGIFNALLADGSVVTISYSIDKDVFKYLGDKSDGQVIDLSSF